MVVYLRRGHASDLHHTLHHVQYAVQGGNAILDRDRPTLSTHARCRACRYGLRPIRSAVERSTRCRKIWLTPFVSQNTNQPHPTPQVCRSRYVLCIQRYMMPLDTCKKGSVLII
jgi:hypothetical protein